jgi:hypothetical protein
MWQLNLILTVSPADIDPGVQWGSLWMPGQARHEKYKTQLR